MLTLISGAAHPALARSIAAILRIELTPVDLIEYPDARVVELQVSVQGADVFIVQSMPPPSEVHLFELLLLADAARRAGARRITAVVPYLGYSRQDRRAAGARTAIGARVIADAMTSRVDRVVTVDLHQPAVEGFFSIPVDHLETFPLIVEALAGAPRDAVVVAPDLGAARLADRVALALDLPFAVIHKTRISGLEVTATRVTGDVVDRRPIVVDDMITTGGTVRAAVGALQAAGSLPGATVAATHAILAPDAPEVLRSLRLERLLLSDSVPVDERALPHLQLVGLAPLLAHAVSALHEGRSLATLRSRR